MNDLYFCIFGGTSEGRLFAEFLSEKRLKADLYIATEYGEQFVKNIDKINVHQKRLDKNEMTKLFIENNYSHIIDATHPFAKLVSKNIAEAAKECNLKLYRIIRESPKFEGCTYVDNIFEALSLLNDEEGKILLTTGSKDLEKFTQVKNYKERIFVRILPMEDSLRKALALGFLNKNIICMQGPFNEELNVAMINFLGVKYLLTKESAAPGGLEEKVKACLKTGCKCLAVRKPEEDGFTLNELKVLIEKEMK